MTIKVAESLNFSASAFIAMSPSIGYNYSNFKKGFRVIIMAPSVQDDLLQMQKETIEYLKQLIASQEEQMK